ncbi:MAG: DUF4389 domain-containing protein [Chloroflexi bacterium]|nr:DUF4389 domain-containing protein [Chloroflexota bacterium]
MPNRHPVQLEIVYPESLSRWKIFLKWLFIIPNIIVLTFVGFAFGVISFFAWWAVLFTGRYPRSLFDFAESYFRWLANLYAYSWLLVDPYPPFSGAADRYPPVTFNIDYPERMNQILVLVKWLTIIPAIFVFMFVLFAATIVQFVAWWAILITGRIPRGMFDFLEGTLRWYLRIMAYYYLTTDAYPPFRLRA